ncbi:hypothetical protein ACN47E_000811 [Coniothyrium glycines]
MTKIQLHCPSSRATVDDFVISPYATNEHVLQGVRLAFNIKHAALYTTDARLVSDVHSIQEGERVLVAATSNELMLADAPPGIMFYNGEEGDDMDLDTESFDQNWEDLTDSEMCEHIVNLNRLKPTGRNKLRITQSWSSVHSAMLSLEATAPGAVDIANTETKIEQCWQVTYDRFLPTSMAPQKFKVNGKIWDEKILAALCVMSSFTHGQAGLAREFLESAVKSRAQKGEDTSPAIQAQDVCNAIFTIYESVGALTKTKNGKSGGRERRKAQKERKKKDKSSGDGV